jgi:hypothetical protein
MAENIENIQRRGKQRGKLEEKVAFWPTPRASNPGSRPNGKGGKILQEEVQIAEGIRKRGQNIFPTPTVQDSKNNGGPSQQNRKTKPLNAVAGGTLNPTWVEWLMGYPKGWTDLNV